MKSLYTVQCNWSEYIIQGLCSLHKMIAKRKYTIQRKDASCLKIKMCVISQSNYFQTLST